MAIAKTPHKRIAATAQIVEIHIPEMNIGIDIWFSYRVGVIVPGKE